MGGGESITVRSYPKGGWQAYVLCSLSNNRDEQPLPMRRHFARFLVAPAERPQLQPARVIDASTVRKTLSQHFVKLGIEPYRTYFDGFNGPDKNTYRWGNLQGIAFTYNDKHLLCGMRNPLAGDKAILFVVEMVDEAFDAGNAALLSVSDLFVLDLGGRGVSDLCWDPVTKGYLIAAGKSNGPRLDKDQPFPPNTLDSALFWWSGRKSEKLILFVTVPEMKIEAICRLGSSRCIAIGSDEGDESEGRERRQSILTIIVFDGFKR